MSGLVQAQTKPSGGAASAVADSGVAFVADPRLALRPMPAPPLNFWNLCKALRRRWLPALLLGMLLGAVVVGVGWALLPPAKYTARSLLHVAAFQFRPIPTADDGYNHDLFQRSQSFLARSRFVINAALKNPEVSNLSVIKEKPDPRRWLEDELQVDFSVGPETMRISLRGTQDSELVLVVSAITKAYLNEIANKEQKKRLDRLEELKKLYAHYDEKIDRKKRTLRELYEAAQAGNSNLIAIRHEMLLTRLSSAQTEHALVLSKLRRLQLELSLVAAPEKTANEMSAVLYSLPPTASAITLVVAKLLKTEEHKDDRMSTASERIEELVREDSTFKDLAKHERRLMEDIRAQEAALGPDAPRDPLEALRLELNMTRRRKDTLRLELLPRLLDDPRFQSVPRPISSVAKGQSEYNFLRELERVLENEIIQLDKDRRSLNKTHLDVDALKDELSRWEGYWRDIAKQVEAMEALPDAGRVSLLEDATAYGPDSRASRFAMLGMGGLGSLGLVLLAFAWLEFRTQRVDCPEQVMQVGMRLVGTVPDYALRGRRGQRYDSILSDSVDAVRTTLLFMSRMESVRTVVVTSAVSGEGKTSSATHLAASLARSRRRTLLLDCDMRNPVAHTSFGLELTPGLSEVLRGECDLASAVRSTEIEGLCVLPAGKGDLQAVQALALDLMAGVLQSLKEQFDFIVIDSSPVLPVPDALLVAQHADGVVLSVLRDVSTLPNVQAAYAKLAGLGIRILGAVFNGSKENAWAGYPYALPEEVS